MNVPFLVGTLLLMDTMSAVCRKLEYSIWPVPWMSRYTPLLVKTVRGVKENADVSARVKNLASAFSDTTYRAGTLSKIGISVNSSGKMTINESKLAQSLVDDPGQVETILGKGGLASKAESNVSLANAQADRLFPTVDSTLGKEFKNSEMYTGQSLLRISQYSSVGNFLSLLA